MFYNINNEGICLSLNSYLQNDVLVKGLKEE
jgi:hypothetical protein